MDYSGGTRANAASARPDPSPLTTAQLLDISTAAACNHARDAPDFAHLVEETLPKSRAYVYATGTPIQQGFLEEERRAIKIPGTFNEAITSPKGKQWKVAMDKEMSSLVKHQVYKLVPITSVPKGDKILGTRFAFKRKVDGSFKASL